MGKKEILERPNEIEVIIRNHNFDIDYYPLNRNLDPLEEGIVYMLAHEQSKNEDIRRI